MNAISKMTPKQLLFKKQISKNLLEKLPKSRKAGKKSINEYFSDSFNGAAEPTKQQAYDMLFRGKAGRASDKVAEGVRNIGGKLDNVGEDIGKASAFVKRAGVKARNISSEKWNKLTPKQKQIVKAAGYTVGGGSLGAAGYTGSRYMRDEYAE